MQSNAMPRMATMSKKSADRSAGMYACKESLVEEVDNCFDMEEMHCEMAMES